MGETAPLLFTVSTAFALTYNLNQQMNTLPFLIFTDITNPRAQIQQIAWGAALTLVVIVLIFNLVARLVASRRRVDDPARDDKPETNRDTHGGDSGAGADTTRAADGFGP